MKTFMIAIMAVAFLSSSAFAGCGKGPRPDGSCPTTKTWTGGNGAGPKPHP